MSSLHLRRQGADSEPTDVEVDVSRLLLAGYTGRDRQSVEEHVRELETLGVAPPPRIPMVYDVPPGLVRVANEIVASGPETSGEVEVVLVRSATELLVGVGSDHTDRAHEAVDVDESKGMCAKPLAPVVWRQTDVADHWDELQLRSWTVEGTNRRLYQEGTLAEFLGVDSLFDELRAAGYESAPGTVVFGGTLPTREGLAYGDRFEFELSDPVLDRAITGGYGIVTPADARADG